MKKGQRPSNHVRHVKTKRGVKVKTINKNIKKKPKKFIPPKAAQLSAKRALRWKAKYPDEVKAMTRVGWARARQLARGDPLSFKTVKRMARFNRHRSNAKVSPEHKHRPWRDNGRVAWDGWGSDTGIAWAKRMSKNYGSSLFRKILPSKGVYIDPKIPKSEQKEISEEFRKHPDLLSLLNHEKIFITTSNMPKEFGTVKSHIINDKIVGPINMSLSESHFRKKRFLEGKSDLRKTLAHELKHVEQLSHHDKRPQKVREKEALEYGLRYGG